MMQIMRVRAGQKGAKWSAAHNSSIMFSCRPRPIRGSAAELISDSWSGLAEMLTRPDVAFKCGPSALARILALQPSAWRLASISCFE